MSRAAKRRAVRSELPDVVAQLDAVDELEGYLWAALKRIRDDPLAYSYPLHAMQERVIASTRRRRAVVAANRAGKTDGSMRDALWCARGDHPYRKVRPHSNIWIGSPDYPSYIRFHLPAFDKWCPPSWIVGSPCSDNKRIVDIRRVDGGICRIHFLSYDMPRSKWQGAGVDGIWLDEEPDEDIVGECLARILTTRGWILLTFTPVEGIGWWYDRIWLPGIEGRNAWECFEMPLATRDTLNPADYEVGQSLVPHLTREQIVEFASEYPDPDEQKIRVFGAVTSRKGLVYKGYHREIHLVPRFKLPPHYDLWGAVDPGYHGFAAIIGALSPEQRLFIAEEFFSQQQTTATRFRALAQRVRALRPRKDDWHGEAVIVFFVDTEDPQVVLELNTEAAKVVAAETREHADDPEWFPIHLAFASLDQGLKARKAGFLRVQQILAPDRNRPTPQLVTRPRHEQGEPGLYFFDDLHSEWQGEDGQLKESRVLWEINRYSWKRPSKAQPAIQPDDADENSAAGAHAMATLRYLTMARLGPPPPPKDNPREDLPRTAQDVWDDVEELERMQLEEAGLL